MIRDTIAARIHERCLGEWETEPAWKSINHDASAHHREADMVVELVYGLASEPQPEPYAVWCEGDDTFIQIHP